MPTIAVTHVSDPGCPWAYSSSPALTLLRYRYGDQLEWRDVMIGLHESGEATEAKGYTPAVHAKGYRRYARHGMPFARSPRSRAVGTWRACRAVVAARLLDPEHELAVFRALQFAQFTEPALLIDTDEGIEVAIRRFVDDVYVDAIISSLDDEAVDEAFAADRAEARTAAGSATEFMDRAATGDGRVRYTAPSLLFAAEDRSLDAGGFQPFEVYDAAVANLDVTLGRRPTPALGGAAEVLSAFSYPLATREVAECLAERLDPPDDATTEDALIDLVHAGRAERIAVGDGALWRPVET